MAYLLPTSINLSARALQKFCDSFRIEIIAKYPNILSRSTFVIINVFSTTCFFNNKKSDIFRNGHMMTHRSKKPFECKVEGCDKSYCDSRSLRRHLENHHQHNLETVAAAVAAGVDISTGTSFFHFDMPHHHRQQAPYHQERMESDPAKSPGYLQQVSPISPAAPSQPRQTYEQLEYVV